MTKDEIIARVATAEREACAQADEMNQWDELGEDEKDRVGCEMRPPRARYERLRREWEAGQLMTVHPMPFESWLADRLNGTEEE